jgi:hypothetical protein
VETRKIDEGYLKPWCYFIATFIYILSQNIALSILVIRVWDFYNWCAEMETDFFCEQVNKLKH